MVITAVQVGRQAGVKPPTCAIVLATIAAGVAVVVSVGGAEGPAIVVVALAVAQSVSRVAGVFPRCQTVPATSSIFWFVRPQEQPAMHLATFQLIQVVEIHYVAFTFQFSFSFLRTKHET